MKKVEGHQGVSAVLIAGANQDGTPAYSGAIKQIKVKSGAIEGEAHVSPSAKPIKFKPGQGAFVVHTTAPTP